MQNLWTFLQGKKTYVVSILGIIIVLVNHFIGPVPGANLDPNNWAQDIVPLVLAMTVRHGITTATKTGP